MEKHYVFAYGGESQNSGRACGPHVTQRINKIVAYILAHPNVHYTVLFAAGKSDPSHREPLRHLMKRYLETRLQKALKAEKQFIQPDIVLLTSDYCSIKDETMALAAYLHARQYASCHVVFSWRVLPVILCYMHIYLSKHILQFVPAWMPFSFKEQRTDPAELLLQSN